MIEIIAEREATQEDIDLWIHKQVSREILENEEKVFKENRKLDIKY